MFSTDKLLIKTNSWLSTNTNTGQWGRWSNGREAHVTERYRTSSQRKKSQGVYSIKNIYINTNTYIIISNNGTTYLAYVVNNSC